MKRNRKIWGTEECASSTDRMFGFAVLSVYYYLRAFSLVVCGWLREEISQHNAFACAGRGFISQTAERPLQFTSINMPKTSRGLRSLFVLDRKYMPPAMRKRECEFVFNLNLLSIRMGYVLWRFSMTNTLWIWKYNLSITALVCTVSFRL